MEKFHEITEMDYAGKNEHDYIKIYNQNEEVVKKMKLNTIESDIELSISMTELFVEQRYVGAANALFTTTGMTSSNESYNEQLKKARPGEPSKPFPCIWSAQLKAQELLASGLTSISIIIKSGYREVIGSPTQTQNGDLTGGTNNLVANIQVPNVSATLRAFALGKNNIYYIFEENTHIDNICKAYNIYCTFSEWGGAFAPRDNQGNPDEYKTAILGRGEFHWIYGQNDGFNVYFIYHTGEARLDFTFEAEFLMVNMWNVANIFDFHRVNIKINRLYTYDSTFYIGSYTDWVSKGYSKPIVRIQITEWLRGRGLFTGMSAAADDYWSALALGGRYGYTSYVDIKYMRLHDNGALDGVLRPSFLNWGSTRTDNQCVWNIDTLETTFVPGKETNHTILKDFGSSWGGAENCNYNVKIRNLVTEHSFGIHGQCLTNCSNSRIYLEVDNHVHKATYNLPALHFYMNQAGGETNNKIVVKGNFTQLAASDMVIHTFGGQPNSDHTTIIYDNCTFVQKSAGQKLLNVNNANSYQRVALQNCRLVNDGTSEVFSRNAGATSEIFIHDVMTNGVKSADITLVGDTLKTYANLPIYYKI